jgi:mRNA-degrading endonuclease toxin of MazEF toxin-antitoxin module
MAKDLIRGSIWMYEFKHDSAVNLDHIQTVSASKLNRCIGSLDERMVAEVCLALMIATGCD